MSSALVVSQIPDIGDTSPGIPRIGDIAAHYDYLMEHEEITKRLSGLAASISTRH